MVIGNPHTFSIILDVVDEWNVDRSFNNGLLFISIGGDLFLSQITNITLNVEIPSLIEVLKNPMDNNEIFEMKKKEAFNRLYHLTYPDDRDVVDCDYRYSITPWEFETHNCCIFMVSSGEKIRILAAEGMKYIKEKSLHDLRNINISEVIISKQDLKLVIEKLHLFNEKNR